MKLYKAIQEDNELRMYTEKMLDGIEKSSEKELKALRQWKDLLKNVGV